MRALPIGTTGYENPMTYTPNSSKPIGHTCRQGRFAQHDRHNRVLPWKDVKIPLRQLGTEETRILFQPIAQFRGALHQFNRLHGTAGNRRRQRVGKQVGS